VWTAHQQRRPTPNNPSCTIHSALNRRQASSLHLRRLSSELRLNRHSNTKERLKKGSKAIQSEYQNANHHAPVFEPHSSINSLPIHEFMIVMLTINNIMPVIGRILISVLIPIPPRHIMLLRPLLTTHPSPLPPRSAIFDSTPRSQVWNGIFPLTVIVALIDISTGPWYLNLGLGFGFGFGSGTTLA